MEDLKSPVPPITLNQAPGDNLLSGSGLKSPKDVAANQRDDIDKVKVHTKKEILIPCDFYEFQQMYWRSEIVLDEFDQDNVPYSPNLHKMWVRHCQRLQKLKDVENASHRVVEEHQTPPLPGFHYHPESKTVVYDDGNDLLSVSGGTWILNDKDELVSGPVPLSSSSMMHHQQPKTSHGFNPFPNCAVDQSHSEGGNSRMRNRCYSDNQDSENVDYSFCKSSNDSGIDIEGELDHIASQDEFKPPLNSTPQRNGGCIPLFLRNFQMLGSEESEFKRKDDDDEGEREDIIELEDDGISPVARLL